MILTLFRIQLLHSNRTSELTNPQDALIGLEGFSHVWILFLFHNNAGNPQVNYTLSTPPSQPSIYLPDPHHLYHCHLTEQGTSTKVEGQQAGDVGNTQSSSAMSSWTDRSQARGHRGCNVEAVRCGPCPRHTSIGCQAIHQGIRLHR